MARKSQKNRRNNKPVGLYKQSYVHFRFENDARSEQQKLEKKYPKKEIKVVKEQRKKPQWKKYCVCEFVPFKRYNRPI